MQIPPFLMGKEWEAISPLGWSHPFTHCHTNVDAHTKAFRVAMAVFFSPYGNEKHSNTIVGLGWCCQARNIILTIALHCIHLHLGWDLRYAIYHSDCTLRLSARIISEWNAKITAIRKINDPLQQEHEATDVRKCNLTLTSHAKAIPNTSCQTMYQLDGRDGTKKRTLTLTINHSQTGPH